ncbi:MAG: helix-turn-helix domain-containing protein [Prevotella sp.]|nr:helix-turn-helix domain-containing protein [Prevotella sp.]
MNNKITQEDTVKKYMEDFGSITSVDAFRDLGVTRLAAVVRRLKDSGVPINSEMEYSRNRYGQPTRYARYTIAR